MIVEFDDLIEKNHSVYQSIWEIQDNTVDNTKELMLINYNHVVVCRIPENKITHLHVRLGD